MSNYTQTTQFGPKDMLPRGDPAKKIRGAEIDVELGNIQTAVNSKADRANPSFSGTVTGGLTWMDGQIFQGNNTFTSDNTFSGNNVFSGNNTFNASNTFSADNTFSGNNIFSGQNVFTNNNTFSGNNLYYETVVRTAGTHNVDMSYVGKLIICDASGGAVDFWMPSGWLPDGAGLWIYAGPAPNPVRLFAAPGAGLRISGRSNIDYGYQLSPNEMVYAVRLNQSGHWSLMPGAPRVYGNPTFGDLGLERLNVEGGVFVNGRRLSHALIASAEITSDMSFATFTDLPTGPADSIDIRISNLFCSAISNDNALFMQVSHNNGQDWYNGLSCLIKFNNDSTITTDVYNGALAVARTDRESTSTTINANITISAGSGQFSIGTRRPGFCSAGSLRWDSLELRPFQAMGIVDTDLPQINGIRFYMGTGQIAQGRFQVYRVG